ncbi:uncharacterized protein LOC131650226 [Vicia villosa]|uniref:uncharacterized protein LOC131650226 n=1 Tax=Vicia villosa TaxID=3911 RepID=UPI00273C398F|nr:uncharacterized protein LOC131650226 [Vicia villosa]
MKHKYRMKEAYKELQKHNSRVGWKSITYHNIARPRAMFILWIACNGRLATKDRLRKIGILTDDACCFCQQHETIQHLLFECNRSRTIWREILVWLHIPHEPKTWDAELEWVTQMCKRKNWKSRILVCAFAETIYAIWKVRNDTIFGHAVNNGIEKDIIDTIVYRCWEHEKLRPHLASLMI